MDMNTLDDPASSTSPIIHSASGPNNLPGVTDFLEEELHEEIPSHRNRANGSLNVLQTLSNSTIGKSAGAAVGMAISVIVVITGNPDGSRHPDGSNAVQNTDRGILDNVSDDPFTQPSGCSCLNLARTVTATSPYSNPSNILGLIHVHTDVLQHHHPSTELGPNPDLGSNAVSALGPGLGPRSGTSANL